VKQHDSGHELRERRVRTRGIRRADSSRLTPEPVAPMASLARKLNISLTAETASHSLHAPMILSGRDLSI